MNPLLAKESKVLIVDDQALAKGYLKYSLEELGFTDITYVDKINLALTQIRRQRFDLIVCSYNLKKEQEGYHFYEEIKNNGELPSSTAFVFISADTSSDIVQSIIELQPDDFLAKPFTVKDLNRRISRVLARKQALKAVYYNMEKGQHHEALSEIEQLLGDKKNAEFFPLALKTKGDILFTSGQYEQAKDFYLAILKVQTFTWAELGLVNTYLHLDMDDEAEKLVLQLAFKPDSQLAAYDLLSALQIKKNDFDTALECVLMATEISPRSIRRHRTAMDLSRITHDYETQFEAAKKIVKFAKDSMHDKPENYLNVARAGIDYAMTADQQDTDKLIKQANEYIKQVKIAFPKTEIKDQISVINARLMYLQDEKDHARQLLEQLQEDSWEHDSVESLLDKAKAFHDVGLYERSQSLLEQVELRIKNNAEYGDIFLHYIQQEQQEKSEIKQSSKDLNNTAVSFYQSGDISQALVVFSQAFTVMPKNPSIALNLLQAISKNCTVLGETKSSLPQIKKCIKAIENSKLNQEQEARYHKVRSVIDSIV